MNKGSKTGTNRFCPRRSLLGIWYAFAFDNMGSISRAQFWGSLIEQAFGLLDVFDYLKIIATNRPFIDACRKGCVSNY